MPFQKKKKVFVAFLNKYETNENDFKRNEVV
ncbi:hypothetical protein HPOKI102_00150 [Helicobacter pylori oki102]|nr:hypothetical protein HPOKI102_00150 [Helicobacter pylori oki102]